MRQWRGASIGLMLMMLGAIVAQRVYLSDAPLHGDICAYAMIGHEMLNGRKLYSDLWERKPPLLYATYAAAELLVGYGRRQIFFLSVATAGLTLVALYGAGCANGAGRVGGLLAAGLWTILCSDLELTANQPDPEVFINLCLAAAFVLFVSLKRQRTFLRGSLIGLLFAGATLFKHNTAVVCAALLVASSLMPAPQAKSWRLDRRQVTESLIATGVIAMVWFGLVVYFAAVGRLHDFFEVVFSQNFAYSGSVAANLLGALRPGRVFPPFMIWALGPAAIVLVFVVLSIGRQHRELIFRREWFIWLAWAIGTWATVAVTGYSYPHYFQLWLPLWCVAGGWAGAVLLRRHFPGPRPVRAAVVGSVFIILTFRQAAQFELTPSQWVQRQFPYVNFQELHAVSTELTRVLKPAESFWELGEDNSLYFDTKHSPPVGLLYIDPLIYGNERSAYWQRLMSDLNRTKPDLVVLSAGWNKFFQPSEPVFAWIVGNYALYPNAMVPPGYQFWLRRGSDVQRRSMGHSAVNGKVTGAVAAIS